MAEAQVEDGVPQTAGWFVLNARDAGFAPPRPGPAPEIFRRAGAGADHAR